MQLSTSQTHSNQFLAAEVQKRVRNVISNFYSVLNKDAKTTTIS